MCIHPVAQCKSCPLATNQYETQIFSKYPLILPSYRAISGTHLLFAHTCVVSTETVETYVMLWLSAKGELSPDIRVLIMTEVITCAIVHPQHAKTIPLDPTCVLLP